jgi:hypothetical protein
MSVKTSNPKPARGWIVAMFGAAWALFAWIAVRSNVITGWLLLLAFTALLLATLPRQLSTTLTLDGVSQWTLRGWVSIAWSEVLRVEIKHQATLKLIGATTTITVSPVFFDDFDGTIAWLSDRLPAVWPSNTDIS